MIDKDEAFISRLQPLSLRYIEANLYESGWSKSNAHFEICKLLCTYITGEEYKQEYGSLKLRIHEITTHVTDYLDESIGLPVPRGYTPANVNESELPNFSTKLTLKLLEVIKKENKEELLKLIWDYSDVHVLVSPKYMKKIK